jgi:3-oxoacyl-[acyl-carrier-protein] synthase II
VGQCRAALAGLANVKTARRVAVTGVGVVSPVGTGRDAFWRGLLEPQPAGERRVHDFDPATLYDKPRQARRADRFEQFATASAIEALEHSGPPAAPPERTGVLIGTGVGGLETLESEVGVLLGKGPRRVSPFMVPMMMANAAAAAVSMRFGFRGPCESVTTACATGTHSIGYAARLIQWGVCDAALAGSSEAAMTPVGIQGFANMRALSGDGRSRPFDAARDGFVLSEGAGVLVLEEWDAALARGATVLAEVLGSASSADAHHITAPAPGGTGAAACIRTALEDAGREPDAIAYINALGTGTQHNDEAEAKAIATVFGAPGPPVTSTKGVTGHPLGAAGALEAVALVLSMQHRLIPPTDGNDAFDPSLPGLDLVTGDPREWVPGPSLSNSFGFGGHNGCLILGPST